MSVLFQEDPSSAKAVIKEIPGSFYKFPIPRNWPIIFIKVYGRKQLSETTKNVDECCLRDCV